MTSVLLKLLLAPALVVASSLAGRRWGPAPAGTLVALPVVAGPILVGWIVCLAADFGFARIRVPAWAGLVLTLAATCLAMRLMPAERPHERPPISLPWWDLPARAVATGALVLTVTAAAARLGPGRTGVLAPFPIAVVGTGVVQLLVRLRTRERSGRLEPPGTLTSGEPSPRTPPASPRSN